MKVGVISLFSTAKETENYILKFVSPAVAVAEVKSFKRNKGKSNTIKVILQFIPPLNCIPCMYCNRLKEGNMKYKKHAVQRDNSGLKRLAKYV